MDVEPYLADLTGYDTGRLLDDWRWLVGPGPYSVFRATAMGDLILRDGAGHFLMLDMVDGRLLRLGETEDQMWAVLADRQQRKALLFTVLVRGLRASGMTLGPGECYSPLQPPILGGELSRENLEPCDLFVHASVTGQLLRQIREAPGGTDG